ncbi:DUF1192 family protein [Rubritepida flocculans]|uniref:DUF1192 family protein n=1 Tax=Rubritepida flocculans TaxID=182403 RepID=UPI0004093DCC|nr:DUF1192 family protein [Rubritepida flocculans]
MFEEEQRPRRPEVFAPAALEGWSEEALRAYIVALQAEIARAEAALAARQAQRAAAEALFRKPSA